MIKKSMSSVLKYQKLLVFKNIIDLKLDIYKLKKIQIKIPFKHQLGNQKK